MFVAEKHMLHQMFSNVFPDFFGRQLFVFKVCRVGVGSGVETRSDNIRDRREIEGSRDVR